MNIMVDSHLRTGQENELDMYVIVIRKRNDITSFSVIEDLFFSLLRTGNYFKFAVDYKTSLIIKAKT